MKASTTIVQDEFIGLRAKIMNSSNPSYAGITGPIIDETRNTMVIRHKGEAKVILKAATVFQFTLPDGSVIEIQGEAILGRPEDRVKKKPKRRW